ncbi:hypothetical protein P3X46_020496 [Hevea brasiliensis]|uniref:Gnk2-homologous domain-containing protein n=1 Tax=Hevea brasiliensis TaxID=3981 RepID=A0ABQ9LR10_HEVBR|nr:hypothetical protein P3X46_020496 [Hevea brasiliensis]
MSPLKLFIILSFLLGVAVTIRARPTYLYHVCPNTTTFTANSTYQANRNILLSSLSSNATANKYNIGFYNTSTGRDPDDIYGLFLCRGDFSSDVCQTCVTFATQDIVERCPVEKVAIIWYDECLLRYSNQFFFSSISQDPSAYLVNTQNISDQNRFNELLSNAMEDAATEAANAASGAKKFAVKETKFTGFQNLYNLVQCTPDLSSSDCNRCLEIAIAKLPSCCDGKQGGRVLSPSCNIRYEVYPFYNATSTRAPPPSPPVVPPPLTGSGQGKVDSYCLRLVNDYFHGASGCCWKLSFIPCHYPCRKVKIYLLSLIFLYLSRKKRHLSCYNCSSLIFLYLSRKKRHLSCYNCSHCCSNFYLYCALLHGLLFPKEAGKKEV